MARRERHDQRRRRRRLLPGRLRPDNPAVGLGNDRVRRHETTLAETPATHLLAGTEDNEILRPPGDDVLWLDGADHITQRGNYLM